MDVLSVIVPIRNDERGIRSTCLEIAHVLRPLMWDGTIDDYEIVLVDDASTDMTGKSADVFADRDRNVVVVHHAEEQGFDAAVRTGLAAARGNLVAHGQTRSSLALAALRPAIEKLRAEGLRSVVLRPGVGFGPARARSALQLVRQGPGEGGEESLPRKAARMRLEPAVPRLRGRTRTGIASLAALSLVITLISFAALSGGKQKLPPASGTLVGRHGHLALIRDGAGRSAEPSRTGTPVASPVLGRAIVTPATPKPLTSRSVAPITSTAIDDTCSTDVTPWLQARIDAAPESSTIALSPKGCYLVPGGLSIAKKNGVTIDGRGAELRSGGITCVNSTQVQFANLIVTTKQQAPAMSIRDCASVALTNVSLTGETGLAISGVSHDISVTALNAQTEHAPVDVRGGQRVAFDHVLLKSTKGIAVDLDPPAGAAIKDLEVRDSSLTSTVADVGAFGDGLVSGVYVHENRLLGGRTKVYVKSDSKNPSRSWRVYANDGDLTQTLSSYVDFAYVTDVLVANNTLNAAVVPFRPAVRFTTAQGYLAIVNNDFTGACHAYTADSSSARVHSKGNTVSNC